MKPREVKIGGSYLHQLDDVFWKVTVIKVERNREYPAGHRWAWEWEGTCSKGVCWGYVSDLLELSTPVGSVAR